MLAEIIGPDVIVLIVVAAIVLLVGGARLPKIARNLGSAKSEFEKGVKDGSTASEEPKP
jgi:Sec-independent protein translocase protein TatA